MTTIALPPLFEARQSEGKDPFSFACTCASKGCDAGLVVYDLRPDVLRAAIVFAPEVPLNEAVIVLPICGVGFQNALGALAPPEVSVHLEWDGKIRLNGAVAGHLTVAASPRSPQLEPDWLVVGLTLALWPTNDEAGFTPDETALFAEGCAEVEAPALLEAWVRHTLVWINRWMEDGPRAVHKEWGGLTHGLNSTVARANGKGEFIGVDEKFGMILKSNNDTAIIPLTDLLTEIP